MKQSTTEEVVAQFFTVSRLIRQRLIRDKVWQKADSPLHLRTLALVHDMGQPSMRDIAEDLHITSPSATTIINRLVRQKDLARILDTNDRRIVRLTLTEKGKRKFIEGQKVAIRVMEILTASLTEAERKKLIILLKKITNQ